MVEEAFRLNVKWSLQELSRAINGDGKNSPNPLFRVKVVLEGDKARNIYVLFIKVKKIRRFTICLNHGIFIIFVLKKNPGVEIVK